LKNDKPVIHKCDEEEQAVTGIRWS